MFVRKVLLTALITGCGSVGIEGEATQEDAQELVTAPAGDDWDFENLASDFWYFGYARTERISNPDAPGEYVAELTGSGSLQSRIHTKSLIAPAQLRLTGFAKTPKEASAYLEWRTSGGALVQRDRVAIPATIGWAGFSATKSRPTNALYVRVVLESPPAAVGLFDNVFLDDASDAGIFANGSFSGPLRDWDQIGSRNYGWDEESGLFHIVQPNVVATGATLGIELRKEKRVAVPVSTAATNGSITLGYTLTGQGAIRLTFFDASKRVVSSQGIQLPAPGGEFTYFAFVIPTGTASIGYSLTLSGRGSLGLRSSSIYNGRDWTYHHYALNWHIYESLFDTFKTLGVPYEGTSANYRQFDDSAAGLSLHNEDATLPGLAWESYAFSTQAIFTRNLKMSFSLSTFNAQSVAVTLICYTAEGESLEGDAIYGGDEVSGDQEIYFLTPEGGCYQPDVRFVLEGTGSATLDSIVIKKTL